MFLVTSCTCGAIGITKLAHAYAPNKFEVFKPLNILILKKWVDIDLLSMIRVL
jgi:hypothetical protein